MSPNSALIVLPTYNECENIERLVPEILSLGVGVDVLVIDDNSPDGTGQVAETLRASHPELHVMHRVGKIGLGTAYRAGFGYAIERGYEQVLTMDADFSHQPRYLPELVRLGREADLVIGSRYTPGGGASGWPLSRKIISGTANRLARLVLGVTARDCTSGYRCYKREALIKIDPESVLSSGYSFLVEMLYRVESAGLAVREAPIIFVERQAGKSKISRVEVYKTLYTLGRLRLPWLPWRVVGDLGAHFSERGAAALVGIAVCSVWLLLRRRR